MTDFSTASEMLNLNNPTQTEMGAATEWEQP